MNWITIRMDLRDNQTKAGRICLSKFALGTIQEGQFLYNLIEQVTSTILIATILSLSIFLPLFSQGSLSNLYHLPFSSFPYTWTVDCSSWFLSHPPPPEIFGSSYIAEKTLFRDHFLINAVRELTAEHSMRWQQLSLRYFWAPIPLVRSWWMSLSLKLPGRSPWTLWYTFDLCLAYLRRYSSLAYLPICNLLMGLWAKPTHYYLFVLKSPHILSQGPMPNI